MNRTSLFPLLTLAGISAIAPIAHADEVIITKLEPVITATVQATKSQKIELSETKPEGLKNAPVFSGKPQYGVIKLGDAKDNRILLALDVPEGGGRIRLFVDTNGDGDLTNDGLTVLTAPPAPAKTGVRNISAKDKTAEETAKKALALIASVPLTIHYNLEGRGAMVPSAVQFSYSEGQLSYNRGYSRLGKITNGKKTYSIALVDQNLDAKFDSYDHEEDEPTKVTILVDRNSDGKFDFEKEAYDAAKPIRIFGGQYKVRTIDAKGTRLTLRKSPGRHFKGSNTASDLKVGALMIEFDADLMTGESVSFTDDYRGKIVLLDFWATWCPPCIAEMPNVVKVYNEFHGQGFEILGVSLDRAGKTAEINAFMQEYGMTWDEIYDGLYWKAEIAQLYGINAIPTSFLVDGNTGNILAMGDELRGDGLLPAVQNALKNLRNGN